MLRIAIYAIAKNEEQFVKRFCDAGKDADMIVVGDTGSTDHTVKLLKAHGATVYNIHVSPWRFDKARDAVLALLPKDVDVCLSLDLDEVLQPGWRKEIEKVWKKGETTQLGYMFDWGIGIKFRYEKIHARNGFFWKNPCHEYPVQDGRCPPVWAETKELLVIHKPDNTKSRGQYLDILKISTDEDPWDPRNAFYYARELSFHRHWEESIKECNRYLALPKAGWKTERCYAYRVIGRCYCELGRQDDAERAFLMGAAEAPETREPWCELSMLAYRREKWWECYLYAKRTLAITNREMIYTVDNAVWEAQPHDLAAISAWKLDMVDEAKRQIDMALYFEPTNERFLKNKEHFNAGAVAAG